ncbi:MAG: hypothetical protein WC759_00520 [Candidatus Micrarchaeia archaeon]|jgi:hypothetical protein
MFEGMTNGLEILKESVSVLFKYPVFAVPLLLVWALIAPTVLYFYFFFDAEGMRTDTLLGIVFVVIYFYSLLFTFSAMILLELMQQHETGRKLNLMGALSETLRKDIIGILVISLLWAIVWFALTVIQAMLSRKKKSGARPEPTPAEAAGVLSGTSGGGFSWLQLGIKMIQKLVRMGVYLVLPAIAWEDRGAWSAIKRGTDVLRGRIGEFMTAYAGSGVAGTIVFLPASAAYVIGHNANWPDYAWYIVIFYTACAWAFSMYLEQMSMALLFLWHKKWEAVAKKAQEKGLPAPALNDVPKPSLLDDMPDLAD